ncbi:SGNH/GDSL hydrolase family protein [Actinomadura fibrosa]|uniref:SGNH/GDSL hydrolase family protein n=1 Tax=Actinomadura fibrosa TaxID=111802 RepID=A0ABW2XUX0_9ACTN|nr:SGNH/GDSL hydrolase family protein [Actinomadura fibrosa]
MTDLTSPSSSPSSSLTESTDPYCVGEAEADRLLAAAPWRRFAVVGDSLARGIGEPLAGYADSPWCERVAGALRRRHPDLEYRNFGVVGQTAAQVRAAQLGPVLEFAPDLVGLVAGGNDVVNGTFAADAVEAELDAMTAALREAGADVVLFAVQDISGAYPELAAIGPTLLALADLVRAVARRHDAILVDMAAHPTAPSRDMYSSDLLHSSMRGHAVIAAATLTALAERTA